MSQYSTDANLAKRIAIYKYRRGAIPWTAWYFGKAKIPADTRLLDVGCGNAHLWSTSTENTPKLQELHLVDLSPGMIDAAKAALRGWSLECRFYVAPVEHLPFPSRHFDVVLANHMLYHAADVRIALLEIARVLKSDGLLVASTNGRNHMMELQTWMREANLHTSGKLAEIADRFGLENGAELLGKLFTGIEIHRHEEVLEVPETKPVIDYASSIYGPGSAPTEDGLRRLEANLQKLIQSEGKLTIHLDSGLFRCVLAQV